MFSVAASAADAPDRPALVVDGRVWTYGELRDATATRVDAMRRTFARDGRPVIHIGDRSEAALITVYAALEAQVPLYLLHPRWTKAETRRVLDRSGAERSDLRGRELLAFIHTSGSTGTPKAIALSRSAFAASARASATNLPWKDGDRWLLAMTPAHVGGLSIITRCLAARCTVVATAPGRFAPGALIDLITKEQVTLLSVVPTMLARLLEHLGDAPFPPSLRAMLVGGAAVPPSLLTRVRTAGVEAMATYGMTETCSQIATQAPGRTEPGARPLTGIVVRIRDGRILVGGPTLTDGVLRDGRIEPPLREDGLLPTGDLGALRDGILHVFGRADDRIVTGGENVDPSEVEGALSSLPGVAAAVVFGTPDPQWGEVVSAAVVGRPDPDPEALEKALRETVSGFRIPRRWHVLTEMPKTASGKLDRRAVIAAVRRQQAEDE